MSIIYQPGGRALEYSPLALNLYKGCGHGCSYCYSPAALHMNPEQFHAGATPRDGVIGQLQKELKHGAPDNQILLSFTCDPYCLAEERYHLTREVLILLELSHALVAVLTKGGTRCLRDDDIFQHFVQDSDGGIRVGATLTFLDAAKSKQHEPRAALPADRIAALQELNAAGIHTWASIEPVIEPEESLAVIRASLPFVDEYKIGKLNHQASNTDWAVFLRDAVAIMREAHKSFYVKEDLRAYCPPDVKLNAWECDMDHLTLKRPPGFSTVAEPKRTQARLF